MSRPGGFLQTPSQTGPTEKVAAKRRALVELTDLMEDCGSRLLGFGSDGFENGVGVGKLSGLKLGKDFFAVDRDFEGASTGRNQAEGLDLLLELEQFLRQTDGMGLVVSSRAILDFDVEAHGETVIEECRTIKLCMRDVSQLSFSPPD